MQMIFGILIGAQWQNPNGNVYVPYFYRNDSQRNLNLNWIDNDFNSHCRFLVARQSFCLSLALWLGFIFKEIQPAAEHFTGLRERPR